ncbi:AAA family ATPase [Bacillus sp. FJAT-27986]|uniref:AAA family ATPase n=1 Tax=Bacillus sp. FJAT-27986 TaxID=1743146 RepID=UPI00080AEA7E|nr:AAA family ATPase [Bacillus sp. FJAT-27986]OCA86876.1 stage V sporulation protein K [Bacillus sp. FJAT-27986]
MELSITNYKNMIDEWERTLTKEGSLPIKTELLSVLQFICKNQGEWGISADLEGKLLYLLALERSKQEEQDDLYYLLLDEANRLLNNRSEIQRLLETKQLNRFNDLYTGFSTPTLRETDNRTAKRNTVGQIMNETSNYMNRTTEALKQINQLAETDLIHTAKKYLNDIFDGMQKVISTAKEYEETLSGNFHTAIVYQELKYSLNLLNSHIHQFNEFISQHEIVDAKDQVSALAELNEMVGLIEIKKRVNQLYQFLKYQKHREELGFSNTGDISLNMILTGNPGTGKTTLARLLGKIYYELGILPKEKIVEVDRSKLVGAYVGQTEENVRKAVEEAVGGVLFIDEAYSLKREGQQGTDYGQTVIDTLISLMDSAEYSGRFAVILAGYPEEMRQFLDSNPGLRSRFPNFNYMELPDYSLDEMIEIAIQTAEKNHYFIAPDAIPSLKKRIEYEMVDQTFGNARTVKSIVMDAIFHKGSIGEQQANESFLNYLLLQEEDFSSQFPVSTGNPQAELKNLVGLDMIKEEIHKLSAFVKIQQSRRQAGVKTVPVQLHAVFTGNPGTGKTTVAKLYSEILRDCGLLKRGHLVVASRADFVAGYVGQTAIKTKKKVQDALGGVLFIDEAYSLLSSSNSDYGKEVVNTLVDEMTKHNENLVIILAGYPDEMKALLSSNPGFSSRFKKFMHFPDYSTEELMQIIENYARKYQYILDQAAKDYLVEKLNLIEIDGNGRFAINLVDNAIQVQAVRLIEQTGEDLAAVDYSTLTKADFQDVLE